MKDKKLYDCQIKERNNHPEEVEKSLLIRTKKVLELDEWDEMLKLGSFIDDQVDAEQDAMRYAKKKGQGEEW